jgi:hypothetical protein
MSHDCAMMAFAIGHYGCCLRGNLIGKEVHIRWESLLVGMYKLRKYIYFLDPTLITMHKHDLDTAPTSCLFHVCVTSYCIPTPLAHKLADQPGS